MLPAHERLHADQPPAVERDDRLVVRDQLVRDRAPQRGLDLDLVARALARTPRRVELRTPSPASLGAVHGVIAPLAELLRGDVLALGQHHADARPQDDLVAVDHERPRQLLGDPPPDGERAAVAVDALAQDGELVTAQPRHGVMRADGGPDPHPRLAQHVVARAVAEAVVEALEAVEVDEQHGDAALPVATPLERVLEAVVEHRPVREAREVVVDRQVGELDLGALAVDRVADRPLERAGVDLVADEIVLRAGLHRRERERRVAVGAEHDDRDVGSGRLEPCQRAHRLELRAGRVEQDARHARAGEVVGRLGDPLVVHARDPQALGGEEGEVAGPAGLAHDEQPGAHARLADVGPRPVVVTSGRRCLSGRPRKASPSSVCRPCRVVTLIARTVRGRCQPARTKRSSVSASFRP